jgi:hypothetical protein
MAIISGVARSPTVLAEAATQMDKMTGAKPSEVKLAEGAMSRLQSVGLNTLPTWLRPWGALSNGQRKRAAAAVDVRSCTARDDFGATVDHYNKLVGAAGVGRLVRRLHLHSVVLTAVDHVAVPWSGADWCLFLPSVSCCGLAQLAYLTLPLTHRCCGRSPQIRAQRPAPHHQSIRSTSLSLAHAPPINHSTHLSPPPPFPPIQGELRINLHTGAKPDVRVTYEPKHKDNELYASAFAPKLQPPIEPAPSTVFIRGVFGCEPLDGPDKLTASVKEDFATDAASQAFEVKVDLNSTFVLPRLPCLPREWLVGLLLGTSG